MACCEVKSLIKFLQTFGGDVISGQTKFAVTPEILKEINEVTRSIREDIFISPLSNNDLINKYSNNDDLMFLYDFVKKTPKLKISNTVSSHKFSISVSDFNNLKYLELYKFNVKYVRGIQLLRETLEMVVCVRCLDKISDLLLSSDTNASTSSVPSIWNKLRHAVLSRNNLISLDESFIHTPWLQYLDVSYNNLTDIRPLTCLRNLTHLNASYNHLTELPKFAMSRLKVLVLNNNYLSNISGISTLESLQECNLSNNCIAEHANLIPLAELSWLQSLNIQGNPLAHHHMHRSLTCGYLHESVANKHFLLDNRPFTSAEREFIRYSPKPVAFGKNSKENIASMVDPESSGIQLLEQSGIVKKMQKKPREAVISNYSGCEIAETSLTITKDEGCVFRIQYTFLLRQISYEVEVLLRQMGHKTYIGLGCKLSTPHLTHELYVLTESDDKDIITFKEKMEALRKEQGPDFWLRSKSGAKVEDFIGIGCPDSEFPKEVTSQEVERILFTEITNNVSSNEGNIISREIDENRSTSNDLTALDTDSDANCENSTTNKNPDSGFSDFESGNVLVDEAETSDESYRDIIAKKNPWVVERIKDDKNKDTIFLILDDCGLEEVDTVKLKVLTQWSMDCIERYIKISNNPYTLKLIFDVPKRNNRYRTYVMEYADAQALMKRIDTELESRHFQQILHLRCMKCDALFCQELPKRSMKGPPPVYACTTCESTAVLQEDVSELKNENTYHNNEVNTPLKTAVHDKSRGANVTQSPSLSSIGSAASLDQNPDSENNGVSHTSHPESDIEVISNPTSDSSVEILDQEPNGSNETESTIQRSSERNSTISTGEFSSIPATLNQTLIESSSSGSMTDSSCTTVESTNCLSRGPHRTSQSVDETLLEESSSVETSPQCSVEERSIINPVSNTIWNINVSGVLQSVSQVLMLPSSTPRKSDLDSDFCTPYEYSYADFASVDHRIKLYFWDQITTHNEEISAFVRVSAILKIGCANQRFSGLVFFTSKKMYLVKITNKEIDENPNNWLQKYDSVPIERIKLIKPILLKQGFRVNTEDRLPTGENVCYVILFYDQKRTEDFLSFVRDRGIVHVQMVEDSSETRDLIRLSQIHEDVRNLTIADSVTVRHKDGGDEIHHFVALVITSEECIILKLDELWSSPNEIQAPSILCKERLLDLETVEVEKEGISLQFENEIDGIKKSWFVNTVSSDTTERITDAIREPWEKFFDVQLPTSRQAIIN